MGWTFIPSITDKADMVSYRIRRQENDKFIWNTIAHSLRGNVLWMVVQRYSKETGEVIHYILCNLLQKERNSGWGYKEMSESEGPMYYSCPIKFFKMVPVPPNDWAKEWREKVLAEKTKVKTDWKAICNQAHAKNLSVVVFLENCGIPYAHIYFIGNTMCGKYKNKLYRIPKKQICEHRIVQTVLETSMMEIVSELQAKGCAIRIWEKCVN